MSQHRSFSWLPSTLLLLIFTTLSSTSMAAITLESAINIAGSQRMLSQRIIKQYCQIGLNVFPEDSKQNLLNDTALFEEHLDVLKGFSNDVVIQEALEWVMIAWARFKPLATGAVSRDHIRRLEHLGEDLLYASNKVVIMLQDVGNTQGDRLVNIAGRQRMLAQRIAKYYMLQSWGFDTLSLADRLAVAREEFGRSLEWLRRAPETTDEISIELEQAILQWTWFQSVLERRRESSYQLIVADTSDALLQTMDRVTALYETLASR